MSTIGADPEFFLRDGRTGQSVPVIGLIGGSKDKPRDIPDIETPGFMMQEDNVMVEYNIPPETSAEGFAASIFVGLNQISNFVRTKEENLIPDVGACSRLFTHQQLDHPQAKVFGCSQDFNAHEQGRALPPPNPTALEEIDGAWRFAGGHVHLGYESEVPDFVAAAFGDVYLGLASVALDKQAKRRELYGSAGRYRTTPYGIEYRTLSNFWIWDQKLATQIGDKALKLCAYLESDMEAVQRAFMETPWSDVQAAINDEDEAKAADLIAYLSQDLGVPYL